MINHVFFFSRVIDYCFQCRLVGAVPFSRLDPHIPSVCGVVGNSSVMLIKPSELPTVIGLTI